MKFKPIYVLFAGIFFLFFIIGCNLSSIPEKEASPVPATDEPTSTVTQTPDIATEEPAEDAFEIEVVFTKKTNCRSGPGKIYEEVSYFEKDEVNVLVGRNDDEMAPWFYVPKRTGDGYCWVSYVVVSPTDDFELLPIVDDYKIIPQSISVPDYTATNTPKGKNNNDNNGPPSPVAPPPVDVTAVIPNPPSSPGP